jgi:hypothetical protein
MTDAGRRPLDICLRLIETDTVMWRGFKRVLLIVAVACVAFAAAAIVFVIQDTRAPDETYASSLGLTLIECEQASQSSGATPSEAREICRRRVSKKRDAQFWSLGASVMRVRENGATRTIIYEAPSAELSGIGVQNGTVFFTGEQKGRSFEGTAHRFGQGCPPTPYPVVGELSDDGATITLRGKTPQLDANCKTVGSLDRSIKLESADAKKIAATVPSVPPDQELFISTVEAAGAVYNAASGDSEKEATRPLRAQRLCALLDRRDAQEWVGTLSTLSTHKDGGRILGIAIGKGIRVTTWTRAASDLSRNTLIAPKSPLYRKTLTFRVGQRVSFSGSFLPSDVDCILEGSATTQGSMMQPEFIFRFADVELR